MLRDMVLRGTGRPGSIDLEDHVPTCIEPRTAALVRIAVLLSVDSDEQTVRWAVDDGIAAGVEDTELLEVFVILAPVLGTGRLTSALNKLLSALEIDLFEEPGPGDDNRISHRHRAR